MYGSMEESTPAAEAPALGPAEIKFVRKLMATSKPTTGDDERPAGLLHEPQELSTSTLTKLEAASDDGEGSCAPGYTYSGQILFDKGILSSTYPDFGPICNSAHPLTCGNTCCVPVETNETTRVAADG